MARLRLFPAPALVVDGKAKRLSPQQARLLLALMGRPLLARDMVSEVLWPDPDLMPNEWCNVIDMVFFRLRRKLVGSGWTIKTRTGQGWSLKREEIPT